MLVIHVRCERSGLAKSDRVVLNKVMAVEDVKTMERFNELLSVHASDLIVVDCYATWCGPCKQIGPKFEKLAESYANVILLKVDADELQELVENYGVSCLPTFLFFKGGEKVHHFSGADIDKLTAEIDAKIAETKS